MRKTIFANSLLSRRPDIAAQWHQSKNGTLTAAGVTIGSNRKVWWQCPKSREHAWVEFVHNRTYHNYGCPFCSGHRVTRETSLAARAPEIAAQWHRTKNGTLTPADVAPRSNRKVWWQCPKSREHVWQAAPSTRSLSGCPYCAGRKTAPSASLAARFPRLAREWHPQKNGQL